MTPDRSPFSSLSPTDPDPIAWLPYVAPMAAFLALTALEGYLPGSGTHTVSPWYPWAYLGKVVVVAAVAWAFRSAGRDYRPLPSPGQLALAVVVGLGVIVLWVGLDGHYPALPFVSGTRTGFNPASLTPAGRIGFLVARFAGLVLLVPWVEELFWRSFLMRSVIDQDFPRVPVGRVSWTAALVTSGAFALAHPEWLPALLTGLAWAWLLWRTGRLSACLVSHMAANLALGVYVVATGRWDFL